MDNPSLRRRTFVLLAGAAAAAAISLFVIWASFEPRALADIKQITVTVAHQDGSFRTDTFETNARVFSEALEGLELFGGIYGDDGAFIATIDGEPLDSGVNITWYYSVDGVLSDLPFDEQPVTDGSTFVMYSVEETDANALFTQNQEADTW